jgi:SHS family lactate transporter-like MFS transporter
MATSVHGGRVAWWREPTRDQRHAWIAAWLGWTPDAFDLTPFVFALLPIAKDFGVPRTAVTAVFTLTLWLRLVGADLTLA